MSEKLQTYRNADDMGYPPADAFTKPGLSVPQPPPVHNTNPSCHDLVIADMLDRKEFGLKKYGTILQPENGRDFLIDAYQEVLDLAVYLRGAIYEREQQRQCAKKLAALAEGAEQQA